MIIKEFNYLLFTVTRQVRVLIKERTKKSPLTFEQLRALAHISRVEGITQAELSVLLEAKVMATSRILEVLANLDLLVRKKDISDKRAYKLYLTSQGHELMLEINELSNEVYDVMTNDINERDLQVCYQVLEKIQKNAGKASSS